MSILDSCSASIIMYPMPEEAAISSAPISDLQLYPSPSCIPANIDGRAWGRIILIKVCHLVNPYVLPTSTSLLSHPEMPLTVFMNMGKKVANIITAIFDVSPIPNQSINRGIMAMGGICLTNSRNGERYSYDFLF